MKCSEIQDYLMEYWDLPQYDPVRTQVDQHIAQCPSCAEEFKLWQESGELIHSASDLQVPLSEVRMSENVMNRIYQDESWRVPIPSRIYHISFKMRRNLTLVMSFFLALLFLCMYGTLMNQPNEDEASFKAVLPIATAGSTQISDSTEVGASGIEGVPVASISDPILFTVSTIESDPNYWLALSLLGIVTTLLIMHWLSRIRA